MRRSDLLVIGIVVLLVVVIVASLARGVIVDSEQCAAAGGVHVKASSGYVCIDARVLLTTEKAKR